MMALNEQIRAIYTALNLDALSCDIIGCSTDIAQILFNAGALLFLRRQPFEKPLKSGLPRSQLFARFFQVLPLLTYR